MIRPLGYDDTAFHGPAGRTPDVFSALVLTLSHCPAPSQALLKREANKKGR